TNKESHGNRSVGGVHSAPETDKDSRTLWYGCVRPKVQLQETAPQVMKVLIDTSIWSLALRRKRHSESTPIAAELGSLVQDGRVAMIGPVRQELLSGLKESEQFDALRERLRAFPDTEIATEDYEEAASFYNHCRARGI